MYHVQTFAEISREDLTNYLAHGAVAWIGDRRLSLDKDYYTGEDGLLFIKTTSATGYEFRLVGQILTLS